MCWLVWPSAANKSILGAQHEPSGCSPAASPLRQLMVFGVSQLNGWGMPWSSPPLEEEYARTI